jgi:hypothetical protein
MMRPAGRRLIRSTTGLAFAASLGGCLFGGSPHAGAQTVSVTFLTREPPSERVEVPSVRPYAEAVWINGRWTARGDNYAWMPGHWARPEAGKTEWVAGKWEHGDHGWYYTEGQWK